MNKPIPETAFLAGKVLKRSLPFVSLPVAADAPILKRLPLPQGELAHFYDGEEGARYLAFLELRAGSVRGNHYHKVKEEMIYVIAGELTLLVEDIATGQRESVQLLAGDFASIGTQVAHAYQTVQPGQAIEFSVARFNPADLYRFPLL